MPFVINKFKLAFEMSKETFNAIPDVLSKAEEKSALYQACNAVARAYMASITRTSKATSDRAKAYGSALMATRSAIQDPQRCKSDNTLLAVWLLGLYEVRFDAFIGQYRLLLILELSSSWAYERALSRSRLLDGNSTTKCCQS